MPRLFQCFLVLAVVLIAAHAVAQVPDQAPPPVAPKAVAGFKPEPQPAPNPQPTPRPKGQSVNVKLELTITDQLGSAAPVQKTVSLLVADLESGMIRSEGQLPGYGAVQLHVDGEVQILTETKVRARIGLSYDLVDPKGEPAARQSQRTQIREGLNTVLENGKPTVISQSADPVTDRKVTVEVKATIMK